MKNIKNKLTKKNIVIIIIASVLLCLVSYGVYTVVQDMKAASAPPLIYNETHDLK